MLKKASFLLLLLVTMAKAQTPVPPEVNELRMAVQCSNIYEKYVMALNKEVEMWKAKYAETLKKCGDLCKEP